MKFRLKELRNKSGLTQEQMAERLEISVGLYNGLETGKRRMNATYIDAAARIFGVRPAALIADSEDDRRGGGESPGFAEQASPWTPPPGAASAIGSLFVASARNPATHRANVSLPGFGIEVGDILVCDLARLPEPGDLALISMADPDTGEMRTTIRRYLPPFLLTGDAAIKGAAENSDDPNVTPRHPIVGIIRGT